MPVTYYRAEEVYLSIRAVKDAERADKAAMARDLIKKLLDNKQYKDTEAEAALIRCMLILDQVNPTTTITERLAR